jgi:hypothetical protein
MAGHFFVAGVCFSFNLIVLQGFHYGHFAHHAGQTTFVMDTDSTGVEGVRRSNLVISFVQWAYNVLQQEHATY